MNEKHNYSQPLLNLIKPGFLVVFQAVITGVFISTVLSLLIVFINSAQAGEANSFNNPEDVGQGSLLIKNSPQQYTPMALLKTDVNININGLVSVTKVTQIFSNTSNENIEAIYVFPLPENASIDKFTLTIGDELIEGKIMEKKEAQHIYEQAKKEGKKSAIMNQQRANIFKTKVANIQKGSEVSITIEYRRQIDYSTHGYELRFPLVVGPRYSPLSNSKQRADKLLEEVIDISTSSAVDINQQKLTQLTYVTNPQAENGPIINPVSINIKLDAGFEIENIISPSHDIVSMYENTADKTAAIQNSSWSYRITLADQQVPANKDFILQWKLKKSDYPRAALFSQQDKTNPDTFYINMMLMPPEQLFQQEQRLSKEMILVLDTSGSMAGVSISQARKAMIKLLENMHSGDSFNIIQFNSGYESLFKHAVAVNENNIKKALDYTRQLQADGGTEMAAPLREALAHSKTSEHKQIKQVIFITDGNVSNEAQLFSIIKNNLANSRLFTVGIGSAPNSYFMRKAAQAGRGSFTYIAHVDEVEQKMQILFKKLESPLLTRLNIKWPDEFDQIETYPKHLNDLYLGEPLLVNAKITRQDKPAKQQYKMLIEGQGGTTQWKSNLIINTKSNSSGVEKLWARQKISDLMDNYHYSLNSANDEQGLLKLKVTEVSLAHQIISPFTSFVAVSNKTIVNEKNGIKSINIPPLLPEGWTLNVYPGTATIGPRLQQIGWMLILMSLLLLCPQPKKLSRIILSKIKMA